MGVPDPDPAGHRHRPPLPPARGARRGSLLVDILAPIAGEGAEAAANALLDAFGTIADVLAAPRAALAQAVPGKPEIADHLRSTRRLMLAALRERIAERPVLSNRHALAAYLGATMAPLREEVVRALYVDASLGLIRDEEVAAGTVDQVTFHVREVIRRALELGAAGLVLVHNHPSGRCAASAADVAVTRELLRAAHSMGLTLHDHLVVARGGCRSLRDDGRIPEAEWIDA